jgi:hypothetical protein
LVLATTVEEFAMGAHRFLAGSSRNITAAVLTLVLPLCGIAAEGAPPDVLTVKVYPDRYVAAGQSFSDLVALENWSKPARMRVLWLDSCGPESSAQLLAAVERFHRLYVDGVRIWTFDVTESACFVAAKPSEEISGFSYYLGDRFGRSAVP